MEATQYRFASIGKDALEAAIAEAIEQVQRFPQEVAREADLDVSEVTQSKENIASSYHVANAEAGLSDTGAGVLVVLLPTALKITEDIWGAFVLPWLKTRYGATPAKD